MAKKEHSHTSPSEQLPLDKQALWEQKRKEIDKIEDRLGHKLEDGIKETVIAKPAETPGEMSILAETGQF